MQKNASVLKNVKSQVDRAAKQLNGLKHLEPDYREQKINQVRTIAKQIFSKVDQNDSSAVDHALAQLRMELIRLIISERIVNLMNVDISNIQESSLTKEQQQKAIKNVHQACSFTETQMRQAHGESDIQMVYTLGANAIRGALLRYSLKNKDNSLDQLNQKAKSARHIINKQDRGLTVNTMTETALVQLVAKTKKQLQSESAFVKLTAIKQRCFKQIDQLTDTHSPVLQAFNQSKHFRQQLEQWVDEQTLVSTQARQSVKQALSTQWSKVIQQLQNEAPQRYASCIHSGNLLMARTVWTLIVKDHQKKLIRIKASEIRHDLATQIRSVSGTVRYQIKTVPNDRIESILSQGQKMLASVEAGKQRVIIRNQISQSIKAVKERLKQTSTLKSSDRDRALVQLEIFKERVRSLKSLPKRDYVHKALQRFLKLTLKTLPRRRFNRIVTTVGTRIRNSHLKRDQKQILLKSLNNAKYPHVKIVYQVVDKAIAADLKANFALSNRVTRFSYQQVEKTDPTKHYMETLRRLGASFTWQHSTSALLVRLDHDEQIYEDRVARLLVKISRDNYDLTDKHHAFEIMGRKLHVARQRISQAVLDPEFTRMMNDRLAHQFAVRVRKVVQAASTPKIRLQMTGFSMTVKRCLPQVMAGVRQRNLKRLKMASRNLTEWLRLVPNVGKLRSRVRAIVTPVTASIRDATDVSRMDRLEQDAEWKLNRLMSGFICGHDKGKAAANQTIEDYRDQAIDLAGAKSDQSQPVATRFMTMSNRCHDQINFGSNAQLKPVLKRYQTSLIRSVRHVAKIHVMRMLDHRSRIVKRQLKPGSKFKAQAVTNIETLRHRLLSELRSVDVDRVPKVVKSGRRQLEKIEQRIVDHDPIKRHARQQLARLSDQMTKLVTKLDRKAIRKELGGQLKKQVAHVDNQLQNVPDHDVHRIYTKAHRSLVKINVKLVRNVQLQKLSHKIDRMNDNVAKRMKLLNTHEVRDYHAKLNRSYHKAVYLINQVDDVHDYAKIEQSGGRQIDQVYAKVKRWSDTKNSTYQAISNQVEIAQSKVESIHNLQNSERQGSRKLFKQIMLQARAKLIRARNVKQMITAKIQCELLIQNVSDKIHSASILVAQIRETHNEVANSTMNKAQKKAALRQINHIINSGLDSVKQSAEAEKKAKANAKLKKEVDKPNSASTPKNQPTQTHPVHKHFKGLRRLFHKIF